MQRRLMVVLVMLASTAALLAHAAIAEPVLLRQPLATLPMTIGLWRGAPAAALEPAIRDALGVDEYVNRVYAGPSDDAIGLYLGFYESQRRGRTMHSPLNCLPGAGWQPASREVAQIDVGGARTITVNRYIVTKGLDRLLVLYWYQAHDRVVASEYSAKFYLVADALRLNRTDGALVRIVSPVPADGDIGGPERRAVSFVTSLFPILREYLPV
jgi:EpsI family protein